MMATWFPRWAALVIACLGCTPRIEPAIEVDGGPPEAVDATPPSVAPACDAPDMLVMLDRTMSMYRRPDGTAPPNTPDGRRQSKWHVAVGAVEAVTAKFQTTIRFGLELFPRDPGQSLCVTVEQRLDGQGARNPICEPGEVAVPPALSAAGAIASAIDPETTLLCKSTPIGAGLATARATLGSLEEPTRAQYVLLVSDGGDSCDPASAVKEAQALSAAGVKTFVVAFEGSGEGIDHGLLNDLACAGRTAPGFPATCTVDAMGDHTATDRLGPALYLTADHAEALDATFGEIAGKVCCGCIL